MISKTIEAYLNKAVQTIEFDHDGTIIASNDILFPVKNAKTIFEIHPFFEFFAEIISQNPTQKTFKTIVLEINKINLIVDIIINTGSSNQKPFMLIFDKSDYYNEIEEVTQDKNTLFITDFYTNQKNKKLIQEKTFKNKFIANISHDLKTPIAGVIGLLELFRKENLSNEQKELIVTIRESMSHMNRLVSDVFDLSRIEYGQLNIENNSFDIDVLIKNVERVYLEKFILKNIHFEIKKSNNVPKFLIGDFNRILQIIQNLLDNAYKYTDSGKVVFEINLDYRRAKRVRLKFIVKDTGIGFKKGSNDKFESFEKLHDQDIQGSGLGMSIVVNLIKLMKGTFSFNSKVNEGSTFEITLPFEISINMRNSTKIQPKFVKIDLQKKFNVLIADDNEVYQLILMKLLINHGGFYMDVASNGQQAVEMAKKEHYDLILMDLHMPIMSGFDAIKFIGNDMHLKKTKIIALSVYDIDKDKELSSSLNVADYLVKPISFESLFTSINKVLKIKRGQ
ncbi:hybrid sensor histidine kinase/response regulator [uncultured Flavobacterium sp.]|uniref:hybrid sensor histidine kinase/response regulator n=1 Tax=uncultured Flavobacterium sp. TaxID=165435 RepID=UPI0030CA59C9